MERVDVVCLGILVADVIARPIDRLPEPGMLGLVEQIELRAGGCAVNTASALCKLGLRAAVVGNVGDDAFGAFLTRSLDERGVESGQVRRTNKAATSASVVLVDGGGERTFLHLKGASSTLNRDSAGDAIYEGRALHIAGALVLEGLDGEPTAALLAEARRRGIATSLDTVYDGSGAWDRVRAALPHCDLVMPGIEEARGITGERAVEPAAQRLRELGAGAAAITLGPAGCYLASDDYEGFVQGYPVDAVDGTGSGDAFAAGFLFGKLARWPLERCARLANAAGALATTAVGAYEGVGDLPETLRLAGLE
jgi:sugar/nucleoside kinase (ribokinase family)